MVASLAATPAAAAHTAPAAARAATKTNNPSTTGLTAEQALVRAKASDKDVRATAATTPSSTLTAHPNGTFTLNQSLAPVRKRLNGGKWVNLDPSLHRNTDGTISPAVTTSNLIVSGGGNKPLAVMHSNGRSLALSLPVPLPAPTLSGATATYSNVLRGVDLKVTADAQGGFSEVLVVKSVAAAANPALRTLTLAARAIGVSIASDHAGNITAKDRAGHAVFTAPAPQMWDSADTVNSSTAPSSASSSVHDPITGRKVDRSSGQPIDSSPDGPGKGAHTAPVTTRTTRDAVIMMPSTSMLIGPKTVYPLYFATPTFNAPSASSPRQAWTQTNTAWPDSSYWKSSDLLRVGYQDWNSPTFVARSFVQIGVPSQLYNSKILSSQINFTEEWSPSCTATAVELWQTSGISSATTWNNAPTLTKQIGSQTVAHGWSSSCPAAGVGFDVANLMQTAADGRWSNITLGLKAGDETDPYGWKQFANTISVATTYDHAPNTPTSLTTSPATSCADNTIVGDGTVTLYAGTSDPDGGTLGSHFQLAPHGSSTTIASTDPNLLTNQSGNTAVWVIPKTTLENAAGGNVTEFDWNIQVTDFKYTSNWSATCHFSFDPTHPGAPVVTQPADGSTTIGTNTTITINPPASGTIPSSYQYQVNAGDPANVTADANGNATITVKPTRHTNVLTVTSLSAGANYGDSANITFNSNAPAAQQSDGDMSGDGVPDLLTVGNQSGIPAGLWLADGDTSPGKTTGNGYVAGGATDIGINGTSVSTKSSATDYNGATAVSGHFTDSTMQDVLVYYPTGNNAGGALIFNGNGDGSPLATQDNENNHAINSSALLDNNSDSPIQLVNAGNTSGLGTGYPDLIGLSGDASNGYALNLYSTYVIGGYAFPTTLAANTPDGTADWNNWTIATMQLPTTGGSSTAMFLWKKSTGELDLWENLGVDSSGNLTYTAYPVATNWNTGAGITLQAADINGDGNPDLWTVGANETVTANEFTNLSTTAAASLATGAVTLSTAHSAWALNDSTSGTITTAADTSSSLTATATGGANWGTGDLFTPAAHVNGTSGLLATSSPAIATNSDFTVSAWVKPEALGGTVLGQDGTSTSGFALYSDAASQTWRFEMPESDATNPTEDVVTANRSTAHTGAWSQLTATYTQSNGTMALYVNGVQVGSGTHTGSWNAAGKFTIGAYLYNAARSGYFQGKIANAQAFQQALSPSGVAALANVPYITGGTVVGEASGDFNGDGKTDVVHLYRSSWTNFAHPMSLVVTLADSNGDGGFGRSRLIWLDSFTGSFMTYPSNYVYITTGDFNGDGKADIALYVNHTDNSGAHDSVYTLTSTGGGGFNGPVRVWDDTTFGSNTKFFSAGDFNGDGKTDLALFYNYTDNSNQHVGVFTMTADNNGDGGIAAPVKKWDSTNWGPNTKFMSAGDFNGDGKTDLALFYNYTDNSNQHVGVFTMTADNNGDGGIAAPAGIWNSTNWGSGTGMMSAGDFNGDGKSEITLFYTYADYNGSHVGVFTMPGTTGSSPTGIWSATQWGPNTQYLSTGDFNGDGKADISLYYDYANQTPAEFTLTADPNGTGSFTSPFRRFSDE